MGSKPVLSSTLPKASPDLVFDVWAFSKGLGTTLAFPPHFNTPNVDPSV